MTERENKIIVSIFSGAYLLLVIMLLSLSYWESNAIHRDTSTVEDMIEWMEWDIEEGRIDSTIGETYLWNLKELKDEQKNNNR